MERKYIANACQFVIIYYKLGRCCSANAFQFVIIYYKLGRNGITYAFQFVIIYYKLERYYKLGRNSAVEARNSGSPVSTDHAGETGFVHVMTKMSPTTLIHGRHQSLTHSFYKEVLVCTVNTVIIAHGKCTNGTCNHAEKSAKNWKLWQNTHDFKLGFLLILYIHVI